MTKQENEWSEPYLRTDLPAKEYDRLTAKLRADPHLLGKLLQIKTPEDEKLSAALLFDDPNVKSQDVLDDKFKKYLLRDPSFTEEEIGELEELMLEDERYFERKMLIEDELIEDYSRRALSADEAQRFNNFFLITPERREKLAFVEAVAATYVEKKAKGVGALVAKPKKAEQSETAPASLWSSFLAFFRSPNLFAGVAAASVLLCVAVGTLWLTSRQAEHSDSLIAMAPKNEPAQNRNDSNNSDQPEIERQTGNISPSKATPGQTTAVSPPAKSSQPPKSPQRSQERKQSESRKSVSSETADKLKSRESELNDKGSVYVAKDSSKQAPVVKPPVNAPGSVVFTLDAVIRTRSGSVAGGVEKKPEPGVKTIELRLSLTNVERKDDYRIVVQDSEDNEVARREKLKATKNGDTVVVAFPVASFKPGKYTVILSGGTKGADENPAEYTFTILE